MNDDEGQDELVTEEMLWDRIPEVQGEERANTYYELSARIFARGQYDEALALAETARDIFSELGAAAPSEGLAQAYSSILRENKSPIALELACTLGEWWYSSKNYEKVIETMYECSQEHLVDGNNIGAANDMHLIGCAQRELKNYAEAIICFQEARKMFKLEKEVIHVARCDQKIASCYVELGDGEKALDAARKSIDVFETAHDHRRETFALFEFGKAEILLGKLEDGLSTLDSVLQIVAEDEPKDFEFILDIEERMAAVMRQLGRMDEATEVERRLASVREALADEPNSDEEPTLND
jgi:tetratricopeptide (TPR) repeat protein